MRSLAALLGIACLGVACLSVAKPAQADTPWCAPELETLPGDHCFYDGRAHEKKGTPRTLVIFLHGLVEKGAGWQHNQQRGIVRGAKRLGFSVLSPRGTAGGSKKFGENMVAWPTAVAAQRTQEAALVAGWAATQKAIEKRIGQPFERVYVVGFSNGAYYGSSLALRGKLAIDGYALFAGGGAARRAVRKPRVPVFVGVCTKDRTAKDARRLVRHLKKARWPHKSESRKVGHAIADKHLDHAIRWLRSKR